MAAVGDKVQIVAGGIDVTNGVKAKAGKLYGQGGPLWATVSAVVENWNTGGKWGLPKKVTKVRCVGTDGSTVVWQVQPKDIAPNVVKDEPPPTKPPESKPEPAPVKEEDKAPTATWEDNEVVFADVDIPDSNGPYATQHNSSDWTNGASSTMGDNENGVEFEIPNQVPYISDSMFSSDASVQTPIYKGYRHGKTGILSIDNTQQPIVYKANYPTSWSNEGRRREMLNQDTERIQNEYGYPVQVMDPTKDKYGNWLSAKYDYSFIPNDKRLKNTPSEDLETKLMKARAAFGLPVHGDTDTARSMKYFMYNRFKTPDINLAHNKTYTYIFFTRPDLYLMENGSDMCKQAKNHTDTALIWRRNHSLFRLLTDCNRCGDSNNFNLLLSQQIISFNLKNETIGTFKSGASWGGHQMTYGDAYTGRTSDTFSCNFIETSDFSIINLIKLWMTYIDNISSGAWSPNYDPTYCHVFDRALDYAASVYIFKCGVDGEEVLYWSKYYGVYPISNGASELSWEKEDNPGKAPTLNIEFAYQYKKDLSPISLLEFNDVSKVYGPMQWVPAYDASIAQTARPYVGAPYIQIDLHNPSDNDMAKTQIRLKFKKDYSARHSDEKLFKANI